jgi:type VI secretion system secreted protein VgrG
MMDFGFQTARQVSVTTPLGDDVLLFRRMRADDELGRLFEYRLELLSRNAQLKLTDLVGQRMTVTLKQPGGEPRYFDGFVAQFSQHGRRGAYAVYRATLRPWLWFLTRTADCRIWQDQTVPDIVAAIFREHGFTDFEQSLTGSYRKLPYCVQYRETDFNFVSRLLEQEGIYYFFRHERNLHTLVLADSYSAHRPAAGYEQIAYAPPDDGRFQDFEHLHDWTIAQRVESGAMALRSFDFEKPRASLDVTLALQTRYAHDDFEIFDYPGPYTEASDGESYARTWLEALEAQQQTARGAGNARGVAVGALFKLTGYPRADQNKEHLVIAARCTLESNDYETRDDGRESRLFECRFTAIDGKQPFRSARSTPRPVVKGPQTAIVVGKSGEEIWTDAHARVKVQFHWDRYGKADENSSCWVRVAQVWAGKQWGGLYVPRIGQEVIVDFIEGDPDQPIITGRVYNGEAKPPYELPAEATKSTLKSLSSKGGGGFNEIRFEDRKDAEQLFIHAQRDFDLRIGNDRRDYVGKDAHAVIKGSRHENIDGAAHCGVKGARAVEIGGDDNLNISGKLAQQVGGSLSLKVGGAVAESFAAHSEAVSGAYYLNAGSNVVIEAGAQITLKAGGNFITIGPAGVAIKGSMVMINSGGAAGSGSAGSLARPLAVIAAALADQAVAGALTDVDAKPADQAPKHDPKSDENKDKTHYVEIELVDEAGRPVIGEAVRVTLPDGKTVAQGTTDEKGLVRITNIDPGSVQITFPDLDDQAWSE